MIFASDLDRTLIYSKRFLQEGLTYEVIEKKGEEPISHMTVEAMKLLSEINSEVLFVPVTTRTKDEYNRVAYIQELSPEYTIVSNGGKILINGEESEDWNRHVQNTLSTMEHTLDEIRDVFFNDTDVTLFNIQKKCDDMFWMFRLLDETNGIEIMTKLKPLMKEKGWDLTQTGHKMYLVPSELTKWKALSFLAEKLNEGVIVAAGDSLMDLEMVSNATVGITPAHGEIVETGSAGPAVVITNESGLLAGQEILEKVQDIRSELVALV